MNRNKTLFFASLTAMTCWAATAHADYSFNFNNGSDAGLTHYDVLAPFGSGATFNFPVLGAGNDGYRLTSNPSANFAALGPARVGSYQGTQSFADFRMSVDVVNWDSTLNQAIGLAARLSNIGLGTSDGYYLHYNNEPGGQSNLNLDRIDGEVAASNNVFAPLATLDPKVGFHLVFTGIGSTLTGQVFALNDLGHALATVTMVDSTYKTGFTGVLESGLAAGPNSSVDATFDNLQSSAVPEPASVGMLGIGLVGVLGYGWCRRAAACS